MTTKEGKMALQVEYNEVTITYDESENVWRFELRGRERSAESLVKAKEAIDAPAPEKKKPFQRVTVYRHHGCYGENPYTQWEVTSLAESRFGTQYAWVTSKAGGRQKVNVNDLFPVTPENSALIAKWVEREKQIDALRDAQKATESKLVPLDISGFE